MIADVPLLCGREEIVAKFSGVTEWPDKVDTVQVLTIHGPIDYYKPKDVNVRKRARSSLSPRATTTITTSKRLLQSQKDLRDETDLHRKLSLLLQYQQNGEDEKLDGLIAKWTGIVKEAVSALWGEAERRQTGLTFTQFLAALQLGRNLERVVMGGDCSEDEGESGQDGDELDDRSVMNCLLEADQ